MQSDAKVRFVCGPVGSGKTTACIYEALRRAAAQEPAADGIRYTRGAIIRNTLQQIKSSVLKDIQQILGQVVDYRVSESALYIRQGDIDCEILLIPLEHQEDQKRLLSTQLTWAWMNEFVEIDSSFVSATIGRVGRYPSQSRGKPTWHGLFGDSNFGTEDSDWYNKLVVAKPEKWEYWEQPAPLIRNPAMATVETNPAAENVENLRTGYDYYRDLLSGATPEWADRYIFAKWGASLQGQAVFKNTFIADFHIAKSRLVPSMGHCLIFGADFARAPAVVIGQINHEGRLLVFQEIFKENMGTEKFFKEFVKPLLFDTRFVGRPVFVCGDPSGMAQSQIGERSTFSMLKDIGFNAVPAPSNLIPARLASVENWFMQQRGGTAGVLIDPEGCPMLIQALKGRYRYKLRKGGELEATPDKVRPWADLADAFQYLCMGANTNLIGKVMARSSARAVRPKSVAIGGWT